MLKLKIIYSFFIFSILFFDVLSQNVNMLPNQSIEYKTISTPMGDRSLAPQPSESSERIRYEIEVLKDSAFYSLRADRIEKGVYVPFVSDELTKRIVYKGEEIFFELVPDPAHPANTVLFTYLLHMSRVNYLWADDNKHIKYKKFEAVDQLKHNLTPLLLFYMDDETNQTEKLLEKYLSADLITVTSMEEIQEKILNHIERCLFVYYKLIDE